MTPPTKRGRRPVHSREEILRAAVDVFREKGYERATVRDIAARAGITNSSLYSHVASKQELFLEIVRPVIEEGADRMAALVACDDPPPEKLRAAILGAVAAFDAHHPEVSIYVRDFYPALETAEPRDAPALRDRLVQEGIDADARIVVLGILGMINWMHRWYRPGGPRTVDEIGDELALLVLGGLEPRS